ncbi:MAG: PDZ domain-containing protein [Pirellulaceae bacterium]|nr:PDZ domain-containing protein [Pirellulaceae bacterium]
MNARRIVQLLIAGYFGAVFFGMVVCPLYNSMWIDRSKTEDQFVLPGRLVQETLPQTSYRPNFDYLGRSPKLRSHTAVMKSFEQAIGETWKSTVQVVSTKHQLALGLIVQSDGWIVTKASQLVADELACRLSDGSRFPATIMHVNHELDLALLKVNRANLPAIQWQESGDVHVGGWLATTSASKSPIGIGVVSVGPRKIPPSQAVLGVRLQDAEKEGALVSEVVEGGGAEKAGVEEGDVIVALDSFLVNNKEALIRKVQTLRAGQLVTIGLTRNNSSITLTAQLMDLSANLFDPTEMEVNGTVSARASGFAKVFQHDTILAPHQCGGPIVDTHGRVVGINIARAGRVTSYAIPADVVVPAIREMLVLTNSRPVAEEAKTSQ